MYLDKIPAIARSTRDLIEKLEWVRSVSFVIEERKNQTTYTIATINGNQFEVSVLNDVPLSNETIVGEIDARYGRRG